MLFLVIQFTDMVSIVTKTVVLYIYIYIYIYIHNVVVNFSLLGSYEALFHVVPVFINPIVILQFANLGLLLRNKYSYLNLLAPELFFLF